MGKRLYLPCSANVWWCRRRWRFGGLGRGPQFPCSATVLSTRRWWRLDGMGEGVYLPCSANPPLVADGGGLGPGWRGCNLRVRRVVGGAADDGGSVVPQWFCNLLVRRLLGGDTGCGRLKGVGGATRGIARGWPHCGKWNIAILVEFGVWLFRNGAFVWYWLRENYRTGKGITWRKHTRAHRNARCVMPRFKPKTRESSVDSTKTITRLLKCRERRMPQIRPKMQTTGDCGIRSNRCDVRHTSHSARHACIASVIICERL